MEKRSESEILTKSPIKVTLGEKVYEIPVLTVLPTREWRMKLDASLGDIVRNFQQTAGSDTNAFVTGLTGALIHFPEKLSDLLFLYAKDKLPQEEILANGTEEQIAVAFSAVMAVAYPFLPQLAMVRQAVLGSFAQSANSTSLH